MEKTQTLRLVIPQCFTPNRNTSQDTIIVSKQVSTLKDQKKSYDPFSLLAQPFDLQQINTNAYYFNVHFQYLPKMFEVYASDLDLRFNLVSIEFLVKDANNKQLRFKLNVNRNLIKLKQQAQLQEDLSNPFHVEKVDFSLTEAHKAVNLPTVLALNQQMERTDFRALPCFGSYLNNIVFLQVNTWLPDSLRLEFKLFYAAQLTIVDSFRQYVVCQDILEHANLFQLAANFPQIPTIENNVAQFQQAKYQLSLSIRFNPTYIHHQNIVLFEIKRLMNSLISAIQNDQQQLEIIFEESVTVLESYIQQLFEKSDLLTKLDYNKVFEDSRYKYQPKELREGLIIGLEQLLDVSPKVNQLRFREVLAQIYSFRSQINDQIDRSCTIKTNACFQLSMLFWMSVVPLILSVVSGVIVLTDTQLLFDRAFQRLSQQQEYQQQQVMNLEKVFLALLRGLFQLLAADLDAFATEIGQQLNLNDVMVTGDPKHVKIELNEQSIEYLFSQSLLFKLKNLNFKEEVDKFQIQLFKQREVLVFNSKYPSQQFEISFTNDVFESIGEIQKLVFANQVLFFMVPIGVLLDYDSIFKQNVVENQKQYFVLQDLYTYQVDRLTPYQAAINNDKKIFIEKTFLSYVSSFPFLPVSEALLIQFLDVEERFQYLKSVISFVGDIVLSECLVVDPNRFFDHYINSEVFKYLSQQQDNCLYAQLEFLNPNQIQQIINNIQLYQNDILQIQDHLYLYMIDLDLTLFKQQYYKYFENEKTKIMLSFMDFASKFCLNIIDNLKCSSSNLSDSIDPSIILKNSECIQSILDKNTQNLIQNLSYLSTDFLCDLKLLDCSMIQFFDDSTIATFTSVFVSYAGLIKETKLQKTENQQKLFWLKNMFKEAFLWFEKQVTQYIFSLITFMNQSVTIVDQQFVWSVQNSNSQQFNSQQDQHIITKDKELVLDYCPFVLEYIDDFISKLKGTFQQKELFVSFLQQQTALKICKNPSKLQERPSCNDHFPILKFSGKTENNYKERLGDYAFIMEELYVLQIFFQKVKIQLDIQEDINSDQFEKASKYFKPFYIFIIYNLNLSDLLQQENSLTLGTIDYVSILKMQSFLYQQAQQLILLQDDVVSFNFGNDKEMSFSIAKQQQVIDYIFSLQYDLSHKLKLLQYALFPHYQQVHLDIILNYSKLKLENSLKVSKLFQQYFQQDKLFDLLLYLYHHAQNNYDAILVLNESDMLIKQVVVENVKAMNKIKLIKVSNYCFNDLLFKLNQIQEIITNKQFIRNSQFEYKSDICQEIVSLVQQSLEMRYSIAVEQKARDLESLFIVLIESLKLIQSIPVMLYKVQQMESFGTVTSLFINNNQFPTEYSVVSTQENSTYQNSLDVWNNMLDKILKVGQNFVQQCVKENLIKVLTFLFVQLQKLLQNHLQDEYQQVFSAFRLKNLLQYKLDDGLIISGYQIVIPNVEGTFYPHSNLLSVLVRYLSFPVDMYISKLQPQIFNFLLPNIGELIVAKSPIRGLTFIGLRSDNELLSFQNPIKCSQNFAFNFDIVTNCIENALVYNMNQKFSEFMRIGGDVEANLSANIDNFDPIVFSRVVSFTDQSIYFVFFVCLQTLVYRELQSSYQHMTQLFVDSYPHFYVKLIKKMHIYAKAVQQSRQSALFKEKLKSFFAATVVFLDLLNDEIHKNLLQIRKLLVNKQRNGKQEDIDNRECETQCTENDNYIVRQIQLQTTINNIRYSLPLQVYDDQQQKFYLKLSNNSSTCQIGQWWFGSVNKFNSNQPITMQILQIINKMIYSLSQGLPLFLTYFEYRRYQFAWANQLIELYSELVMRRVCYVQVSVQSFPSDIILISNLLICGFLTVIQGIELLPGCLQFELNNLAQTLRLRKGKLPGVYSSIITAVQSGSNEVQLQNIDLSNFDQNMGQIIFLCPVISSVQTCNQLVHVPQITTILEDMSLNQQNYENIQSKQESGIMSHGNNLEQVINDVGLKCFDIFKFKVTVFVEEQQPQYLFEQCHPRFGKTFYQISCYLKYLGHLAPKLYSEDISIIIKCVNDYNKVNIANFLIVYLIKLLPNCQDQQQISLSKLISQFVAISFVLDTQQVQYTQELANMSIACIQSQLFFASLTSEKPDKLIQFQAFYKDFLAPLLNDETQQYLNQTSKLFQVDIQSAFDSLLLKSIIQQFQQPLLLNSFQYRHIISFIPFFELQLECKSQWFFSIDQIQDFLLKTSNQEQQYLIVLSIGNISEFHSAVKFLIAFNQNSVHYFSKQKNLYQAHNRKPFVVVICQPSVSKEIFATKESIALVHNYNLVQEGEFLTLSRSILHNQSVLTAAQIDNIKFQAFFSKQFSQSKLFLKIIEFEKYKLLKKVDQQYQIQDWMLTSLNQFFNETLTAFYCLIGEVFNTGQTIEQVLILKSLIFNQLFRNGMLTVSETELKLNTVKEDYQSSSLDDFISEIKTLQDQINTNENGYDTQGLTSNIQLDSVQLLQQFYSQSIFVQKQQHFAFPMISGYNITYYRKLLQNYNNITSLKQDQLIYQAQKLTQQVIQYGIGNIGSLQFSINFEWFILNYINVDHQQAQINMLNMIYSAVVTAFIQIYLNKPQQCENDALTLLNGKLKQIEHNIVNIIPKNCFRQQPFNNFVAMLFMNLKMQDIPELFHLPIVDNIKNGLINYSISYDQFINITNREQMNAQIKDFLIIFAKQLQVKLQQPYQYLWVQNNKVSVMDFKFGQGILKNLVIQDDKQTLEDLIQNNPDNNLRDLILDQVSVQKLSRFQNVVFDSQRISQVVYLGSILMTPITVQLNGKSQSGKTLLLQTASLFMRDIIDYKTATVQSFEQQSESKCFYQALLNTSKILSLHSYNCDAKNSVLMFQSNGFPVIHINTSNLCLQPMNQQFQSMLFSFTLTISSNCTGNHYGNIQLQDSCLVIETSQQSNQSKFVDCVIEMPLFNSTFLDEFCRKIWPTQSESNIQSFVKGVILGQKSLPVTLRDSFTLFSKIQDNQLLLNSSNHFTNSSRSLEEKQFLQSICNSMDKQLLQPNIYCYLLALRNRSDINTDDLQCLIEQFSTLLLLNQLGGERQSSPWLGVKDLVKQFAQMLPMWEKIIFQLSLEKKDIDRISETDFNMDVQSLFQGQRLLQGSIENTVIEHYFAMPEDFYLNLHYFKFNLNFQALVCVFFTLYGNFFDPVILCRTFEIFIQLLYIKELNNARLTQLLYQKIHIPNGLTGVFGANSMKDSIIQLLNFPKQENDSRFNTQNSFDNKPKFFQGLTLVDVYQFKVPQFVLSFENVQKLGYHQVIFLINHLLDSKLLEQHQFLKQFKPIELKEDSFLYDESYSTDKNGFAASKRVTFEIITVLQTLEQSNVNKKVKSPDYIRALRRFVFENQNMESLDFAILFTIIRISMALAMGLNPIFVVPNGLNQTGKFGLSFPLEQSYIQRTTSEGRNLNTILPTSLQNDELNEKLIKTLVSDSGFPSETDVHQRQQFDFLNMKKFVCEPAQVVLVSPKSIFMRKTAENISLMQYLTYSTDISNIQQGFFSSNELEAISKIISTNWQLPFKFTASTIVSILSVNFSVIMIDDAPLTKCKNFKRQQSFIQGGTAKTPIYEVIKNLKQIYGNVIERQGTEESSNINSCNNILSFKFNQFLNIYLLAGCQIPREIILPSRIPFDNKIMQKSFALGIISVYKWCQSTSKYPTITIAKFSEVAVNICNHILLRCQILIQELSVLISSFKLFDFIVDDQEKYPLVIEDLSLSSVANAVVVIKQRLGDQLNKKLLKQLEFVYIRNIFYTVGELLKQLYVLFSKIMNNSIFDSISCASFLLFCINGAIQEQQCINALSNSDIADPFVNFYQTDVFSHCVCGVLKQVGFQVSIQKPDIQNKRQQICLLSRIEWGMFLNNVIVILARSSPVQFIMFMQRTEWKQNDIYMKILEAASLYQSIGYHTFICDQNIAMSVALVILAQLLEQKDKSIGDYEQLLKESKSTDSKQQVHANYVFNQLIRNVVIIDCELQTIMLVQLLCKTFESTDSTVILTNCGSDKVPPDNYDILYKLMAAKNQGLLMKRNKLQLGFGQLTLFQNLKDYGLVISCASNENLQVFLENTGLNTQDSFDKFALLLEQDSVVNQEIESKEFMHEIISSSIFGKEYSLRSQTEQLQNLHKMNRKLLQDICQQSLSLIKLYYVQDVKLVTASQLEDFVNVLFTDPQKYRQEFDPILVNSEKIVQDKQQFDEFFNSTNLLQNVIFEIFDNQSIANSGQLVKMQKYKAIVIQQGQLLAEFISSAINVLFDIFKSISKYHTPFSIVLTQHFMKKIQKHIQANIEKEVKQNLEPVLLKLNPEKELDYHQIIIYCVEQNPSILFSLIAKLVLPLLFEQINDFVADRDKESFQYLSVIIFLIYIGLFDEKIDLSNGKLSQQVTLVKFVLFSIWQNQKDLNIMRTMMLLCAGLNKQLLLSDELIVSYQQLLPQEMLLSHKMSLSWICVMFLQHKNPVVKETIEWFLVHYSTIAAFSESQQLFNQFLAYYVTISSQDNPITKQFVTNNIKVLNQLIGQIPQQLIQQLPQQWTSLNLSVLLVVLMISQTIDSKNSYLDFSGFNAIIASYCSFDIQSKEQREADFDPSPFARQHITLYSKQILAYCGLKDDFSFFQYLSSFLKQIIQVLNNVYKQLQLYQQEALYSSKGNLLQAPIPLVLIFYDQNLNIDLFLDFAHKIRYNLDESFKIPELLYKLPSHEELNQFSTAIILDPKTNGENYARILLNILTSKRNSNNRGVAIFPIFLLIPSCPNANYFSQCSVDGGVALSDQKFRSFFKALAQLQNIGEPYFIYHKNQTSLQNCFNHFFTLLLITMQRFNIKEELINICRVISLRGISILLLKYTLLSKSCFTDVNDSDFINVIRYLHNQYVLCGLNDSQLNEINSNYVEQNILTTEYHSITATNFNDKFIPVFDHALKQTCQGISKQLFDILFCPMIETTFMEAEDEKTEDLSTSHIGVQNFEIDVMGLLAGGSVNIYNGSVAGSTRRTHQSNEVILDQDEARQIQENQMQLRNELGVYNNLFTVFETLFPDSFNINAFDMQKLEDSVTSLFHPVKRKWSITVNQTLRDQMIQLQNFNSVQSFQNFIIQFINKLDNLPIYGIESPTFEIKQKLTSIHLLKVTFGLIDTQENCMAKDLAAMPEEFRQFMLNLPAFRDLNFGVCSRQMAPDVMSGEFLPRNLGNLLRQSGIYGQEAFVQHPGFWEFSALVYAPVLGDVFNYLLIKQTESLSIPVSYLQIVVQLSKPKIQQVVNIDGSVSVQCQGRENPFYIKLVNFELFNIDYDQYFKSVCDGTPETSAGFRRGFDLFVSVAIIIVGQASNVELAYEEKLKTMNLLDINGRQRVPRGMVAVPMRIGGFVLPFVQLPNRTKRADELWEARNPHFGVRFI